MCDMGEKEINTFFRARLRLNFKLSNHLYTLPWCLYSPRRKDFAADPLQVGAHDPHFHPELHR